MSASLLVKRIQRPSIIFTHRVLNSSALVKFNGPSTSPFFNSLICQRNLSQLRSQFFRNGQTTCIRFDGGQSRILLDTCRRILVVQTVNVGRRHFTRKYKFGHMKKDAPWVTKPWSKEGLYSILLVVSMFYFVIDVEYCWQTYGPTVLVETWDYIGLRWRRWWRDFLRVDAECVNPMPAVVALATSETETDEEDDDKQEKKKKSFRERKIIEYENRIRSFSTPDKIFRYFATIKIVNEDDTGSGEILMTPDDFLRALTPGIRQPESLGLDQFNKFEVTSKEEKKKLEQSLRKDSIFYKMSDFGLINFSDFLFLLTVLSVSRRHFEIAFRMFDLNGDGNVDYEEFEKVQNAILEQTSIGKKMGNSLKTSSYRGVSSALAKYFFGEDLKQKLTIERFLDFQSKLQTEMLTLEFGGKNPDDKGVITETQFGELLIAYGGFSEAKRSRMLKRVKKAYPKKEEDETGRGISLLDYLEFFRFLQNISDVDIALTFFNMAGAGIDKETLKHAARTVAHVEFRDHLIDVIFTLFDENQDGSLSNREFISVMKERLRRGLARPKDTGFMKLATAFWNACKIDGFFL